MISSEKFAVIKPSGGNHVSFIRCFGTTICRIYRRQRQDPAGSAGRKAHAGRKGLVRDRCPHRRKVSRGSHLRAVLPFVRLCPVRPLAYSRGGLRHLYFGDVSQGQDQALRKRLRHFFIPRRSRCRVPARHGDQSGGGGYSYQIASPEKALCDKLYSLSPVYSVRALKELLFDDLRIDEAAFFALHKDDISQFAPLYRAANLKLLAKFMEGK